MKKIFFIILSFIAITTQAQLVSVDDLAKMMKEPNVVVIDARPAGDYMKTHIDGAISIDVSTLSTAKPVEGTLKSASELASIFGKNGVSDNSKIVIYCKTGVSAGLMYWILKYIGADDVSILDGQMDAWFAARKPITKTAKKLAPTTFKPQVNSAIIVDKAQVKAKMNSAVLVDSRKKEEFAAGHIGNAVNIPSDLMSAKNKLKPVAALQQLFVNVPKTKEVIVYCKTGATAGFVYFVMKSVLKYPNVKVYEGAYLDWTK